eukprot:scaffold3323_cov279-Pinguiococcus_pyrenoidosus.AAC.5
MCTFDPKAQDADSGRQVQGRPTRESGAWQSCGSHIHFGVARGSSANCLARMACQRLQLAFPVHIHPTDLALIPLSIKSEQKLSTNRTPRRRGVDGALAFSTLPTSVGRTGEADGLSGDFPSDLRFADGLRSFPSAASATLFVAAGSTFARVECPVAGASGCSTAISVSCAAGAASPGASELPTVRTEEPATIRPASSAFDSCNSELCTSEASSCKARASLAAADQGNLSVAAGDF